MDALSLSTEATYGADSKCHMLVEEATFVQCLFLRPTTLKNTNSVSHCCLWPFGFVLQLPCDAPSQSGPGHLGPHVFSRPFNPNSAHLKDLKSPLPWSWSHKTRPPGMSCSSLGARSWWHSVQRKLLVTSLTCGLPAGASEAGERCESRYATCLLP